MTDDQLENPTESTPESVPLPISSKPKTGKKKKNSRKNKTHSHPKPLPKQLNVEVDPEIPTFILPILPDEWRLLPEEVNADGHVITEERFVFFKDEIEVVNIPFSETNFAEMHTLLSNRFNDSNYIPDHWTIKEPLNGDPDPVMTLSLNGKVLAATSLDQIALKKMVNALQRHIVKPPTLSRWFAKWWEKHKVLRVFASLMMLPVFLAIIFAVVWGFQN